MIGLKRWRGVVHTSQLGYARQWTYFRRSSIVVRLFNLLVQEWVLRRWLFVLLVDWDGWGRACLLGAVPGCALSLRFRRLRAGLLADLRQLLPFYKLRCCDSWLFLGADTQIRRSRLFLFRALGKRADPDRAVNSPSHLIFAPI